MDLSIKDSFCREKCMEKENIFGANLDIGTKEVPSTIIEMVKEPIINHQANLLVAYGSSVNINWGSYD